MQPPRWGPGSMLSGASKRISLSISSLQHFGQRALQSAQRRQQQQHNSSRHSEARPQQQRPLGSFLKPALAGGCIGGGILLAGLHGPRLPSGSLQAGSVVRRSSGKGNGYFSEGRRVSDTLIAINVLMFAAQLLTRQAITVMGIKHNPSIAAGQWWRFVTPAFLHGGLMHLIVNCYSLNNLGPTTEKLVGDKRFLAVYLASGVAGTAASYWMSPYPSLGASGAVFGVGGALAMFFYRHKEQFGKSSDVVLQQLGKSLGINIMFGLMSPNIDNWGHLGGLIGGAAAAFLLGPSYKIVTRADKAGRYSRVLVDQPPIPVFRFKPKVLGKV